MDILLTVQLLYSCHPALATCHPSKFVKELVGDGDGDNGECGGDGGGGAGDDGSGEVVQHNALSDQSSPQIVKEISARTSLQRQIFAQYQRQIELKNE